MASAQDWCLQCGAGAPGSLGGTSPSWRSAGAIIGASMVLLLGAAAVGYAALTKSNPRPRVVRVVAAASTPATPAPAATPPAATSPAPAPAAAAAAKPLFGKPVKIPPIGISPIKIPKPASVAPVSPVIGGVTHPTTTTKTQPSTPAGGSTPSASTPEAIGLDTNAASTYNPYAYPAAEFGDPSRAIDGDTTTGWTAQVNPTVAPKMAEGLVIDLKTPTRVSAAVLVAGTPGMTVQFYGANGQAPPNSITDPAWVKLSPSLLEKKRRLRVTLKHAKTSFRFITLWISRAPASSVGTPQAPGHVSVNELELFPAS